MLRIVPLLGRVILFGLLCLLVAGCSDRTSTEPEEPNLQPGNPVLQLRTAIEEAGLLAGKGPGQVPAEAIASIRQTTSDGSDVEFTLITFLDEGDTCRYVVATDSRLGTVGATGGCGFVDDSFSVSWSVGSIATGGSNFAIAFGSDDQPSEIDRVEVVLAGALGGPLSSPVEDGHWLVVVPAPVPTSGITELRGLSNGQEVETVDARSPHLRGG